jgi:hypothetical protein
MVARRVLAEAVARGRGQQPLYDQELADLILSRIAAGESLKAICREPDMPHEATVRDWVRDDRGADTRKGRAGFATLYTRARELGCDSIAEEIIELSDQPILFNDEPNNAMVQHARLRSENRRWLLSKLAPKRYGDKVTTEITGEDGGALITRIELVPVAARPRTIEHDDSVNGSPVVAQTPKGTRKRQKS